MPVRSVSDDVSASLAPGVELLGEYRGSGCAEAPYLVRLGSGRMVEVSRLLHLVAAEIGRGRDLHAIAASLSSTLDRRVSTASVVYLIDEKLRPLGIVAGEPDAGPAAAPTKAPKPPVLGLAVRLGVLSPDLVEALARRLRRLFAPFSVVVVLSFLLAVEVWLVAGLGLGAVLATVRHPTNAVIALGLTLVAGLFHELGHATASRYGGARAGRIGIGIYLIWPVFYNDLNDSYRLSRAGRLRADLGGIYFNGVFILALTALYWLTGLPPLLAGIVLQHLAVLQQLLPFLRLDGYYLVSDLVGVPDLFGRIRPVLASLIPGRPTPGALTRLKPGSRAGVTAWVLTTVPLLAACLVLLILTFPRLLAALWTTAGAQVSALEAALGTGAVVQGVLSGLQLLILGVAPVGLAVALSRLLRRCWAQPRLVRT